jgi:hypothetical protein
LLDELAASPIDDLVEVIEVKTILSASMRLR